VGRLTTLSVLLRYEQSSLISTTTPQVVQHWKAARSSTRPCSNTQGNTSLASLRHGIRTRIHQQWISTPFCRFGIHVQKSTRETTIETQEVERNSSDVTFASYEALWWLLGYGVHWSRTYSYVNVSPALRVFPVVEDLNVYRDLLYRGTIRDIQQAFRSGVLHPFTKSQGGHTLLHVSFWDILKCRVD
jgi:hypothetical protein